MDLEAFLAHPAPSFFSLFPDALAIVIRHLEICSEDLFHLALVNHECYRIVMKELWTEPRLNNSLAQTPLQCFQGILSSMGRRALSPSTMALIHKIDTSEVEETLYSTLPDTWLLTLLQNAPKLHSLCLSGKKTSSPFIQSSVFRRLTAANLTHPVLAHLDLSDCTDVREPMLKSMIFFFPNLISINFTRTSGVTDTALSLIVDKCQDLQVINLSYCRQVTDLGLFAVAKFCRTNLRVLQINGNLKITDASVLAVAKHCLELEKLFIAECNQITDRAMEWIARSSSAEILTELELHRCEKIAFGLPLLELLSKRCHILHRLTLGYKQINARRDDLKMVMEAFRDFKSLETIEVFGVPEHSPAVFFWDLAFQGSGGRLKTINLNRGSFVTDYILGNYANADEYDQNITDQAVQRFNERRSGAKKATVNLFVDDFY